MKKKGFTLIELIVVIAIIGVLAAILVPAMLGYVKKSKITTANTTAKSIYNAYNSSLTDLDSQDAPIKTLDTDDTSDQNATSGWQTSKPDAEPTEDNIEDWVQYKVYTYFSDIVKVKNFAVSYDKGACVAVGVLNGTYPGSYPKPMTVDEYNEPGDEYNGYAAATDALKFAKTGLTTKSDT